MNSEIRKVVALRKRLWLKEVAKQNANSALTMRCLYKSLPFGSFKVHFRCTSKPITLFGRLIGSFIPAFTIIWALGRCRGREPVILDSSNPFSWGIRLSNVILDAKLLEPAVQVESKRPRLITRHGYTRALLLLSDEGNEFAFVHSWTGRGVAPAT